LVIAVNQQDHCFGKIWIGQVPARDQQLADAQTLGILRLDRHKNGWRYFAFRADCVGPVRSTGLIGRMTAIPRQPVSGERRPEQECARLGYIKFFSVTVQCSSRRKDEVSGDHTD
jgi:hypothetical protein